MAVVRGDWDLSSLFANLTDSLSGSGRGGERNESHKMKVARNSFFSSHEERRAFGMGEVCRVSRNYKVSEVIIKDYDYEGTKGGNAYRHELINLLE
jgi:hypothetical protein